MTRAARAGVALLAAGPVAAGLVMLRLVGAAGVPLPRTLTFCFLREVVGLPCPLCGGTRALLALAGDDPAAALATNPLVTLATLAILAAPLVALLPGVERLPATARRLARPAVLLPLVALDWGYIIVRLAG